MGQGRFARVVVAVVAVAVAVAAIVAPTGSAAAAGPAPVAVPDSYEAHYGRLDLLSSVLANDIPAVPGQQLTVRLVTGPSHAGGFYLGPTGSLGYQAAVGFEGDDTFTYVAVGPDGTASAPATVTIRTVLPHPDPRPATTVVLGGSGLYLNPSDVLAGRGGLYLWAKVVSAGGVNLRRAVQLSIGGTVLCHATYGIFGSDREWGSCIVPFPAALPILLGAKVTGSYFGFTDYQSSQVVGPMPLTLAARN
jgi:hypothetical protein